MITFLSSEVNVTPPGTSGWQDVDVSSYVSSIATGVIVRIVNTYTSTRNAWARKNGSTDAYASMAATCWEVMYVGLDSNKMFEAYKESAYPSFYLVGYFEAESVFFTNRIDKGPSASAQWRDIDISSNTGSDTAIAAIGQFYTGETSGVRKNGSTDSRTQFRKMGFMVAVDSNEIFEGYSSNISYSRIYLNGYIKNTATGQTWYTNGTNITSGGLDVYVDLPQITDGRGQLIEIYTYSGANNTLRRKGETSDFYYRATTYFAVGCDSNGYSQAKRSNSNVAFYKLAIFTTLGVQYDIDGEIDATLLMYPSLEKTLDRFGNIVAQIILTSMYGQGNIWTLTGKIEGYLVTSILLGTGAGFDVSGNIPASLSLSGLRGITLNRLGSGVWTVSFPSDSYPAWQKSYSLLTKLVLHVSYLLETGMGVKRIVEILGKLGSEVRSTYELNTVLRALVQKDMELKTILAERDPVRRAVLLLNYLRADDMTVSGTPSGGWDISLN